MLTEEEVDGKYRMNNIRLGEALEIQLCEAEQTMNVKGVAERIKKVIDTDREHGVETSRAVIERIIREESAPKEKP